MWKWILILVGAGVAVAAGVRYYAGKSHATPEYQTAQVMSGDLVQVVTASGALNPVLNVEVGSQISGRIKAIYVDFNSVVTSNQIIAEIDPSTYQVGVLRAQADLTNSVANLALAQVQARRAEALFANNLIAASDHDIAIAQLQQAQAQVESSRAIMGSAQVDLSRCTIYAPVDGVVISRSVDVGQTVAASFNTPTLFLIANDLAKMQIDALVSEADIGGVIVKQQVTFTVDAYPYRTFQGQVSQIRYGPVTNQNVVNYDCVINVDNSDLKLLPGMTANVSIIISERENVLKIPNAALRFRPPETDSNRTNSAARMGGDTNRAGTNVARGGGARGGARGGGMRGGGSRGRGGQGMPSNNRTVHVLRTSGNSARPELVAAPIKTGISDGLSTEVLEGLKEGDVVVTGLAFDSAAPVTPAANPFGGGGRPGGGGVRRF